MLLSGARSLIPLKFTLAGCLTTSPHYPGRSVAGPDWPWQRRRECQAQEEGAQRASEGQPFPFMTISFLHISHGKGEAFAVSLNLAREAARPWPSLLSPLTGTPLCQAMSL